MNLFITDLRLLRRSGVSEGVPQALPHAMVEAAMIGGLVDGMPFILDDDGAYDLDLNRFFRACPTMGYARCTASKPTRATSSRGCASSRSVRAARRCGRQVARMWPPIMRCAGSRRFRTASRPRPGTAISRLLKNSIAG